MKTAEEILNQHQTNREYPSYYHESNVLEAMEEYASQFQPQWIKINSESDLPKEDTTYYMGKFLNGRFHLSADEVELDDILEYYQDFGFTHYQSIVKPHPPKED